MLCLHTLLCNRRIPTSAGVTTRRGGPGERQIRDVARRRALSTSSILFTYLSPEFIDNPRLWSNERGRMRIISTTHQRSNRKQPAPRRVIPTVTERLSGVNWDTMFHRSRRVVRSRHTHTHGQRAHALAHDVNATNVNSQ